MALKTAKGQVNQTNNVQVPIVNFKTCGLTEGKAYKDFFETHFVVIGQYVSDGNGGMTFQVGTATTDQGKNQIFKYSWCQPDDEKQAKKGEMPLSWHNVMWSDTLLRISDGDAFDDPGYALGLHLKQDDQKNAPGLHGAPNGKYTMIDSFASTVRIPVIWKVTVDDSGNIDEKTGELAWLDLSFYQYQTLLESIAVYDKQMTTVLKKAKATPNVDRMFVVKYVKDPKAEMRERNSVELADAIDPSRWTAQFVDVAATEYPKMLDYIEKRYTFYQPIVDRLIAGTITDIEAAEQVHAAIAEKLMICWGEIDSEHGLTTESLNQLFATLVPQYSVNATATPIPASAVKSSVTIDLGNDTEPF